MVPVGYAMHVRAFIPALIMIPFCGSLRRGLSELREAGDDVLKVFTSHSQLCSGL